MRPHDSTGPRGNRKPGPDPGYSANHVRRDSSNGSLGLRAGCLRAPGRGEPVHRTAGSSWGQCDADDASLPLRGHGHGIPWHPRGCGRNGPAGASPRRAPASRAEGPGGRGRSAPERRLEACGRAAASGRTRGRAPAMSSGRGAGAPARCGPSYPIARGAAVGFVFCAAAARRVLACSCCCIARRSGFPPLSYTAAGCLVYDRALPEHPPSRNLR